MKAVSVSALASGCALALLLATAPAHAQDPGAARPRQGPEADGLRQDLYAILHAPVLARSHWSILVKSLDRGDVLFEHNAGKLVIPASNTKILTMAATAERLGWDHRFETTLESAGPIVDGVLEGDLILRGDGDPSIALRDDVAASTFDDWARQLRNAGVRAIAGRIVANDEALADEELGAGWPWDDMAFAYSGPISAAMYNESLVRITVRPGAVEGGRAAIEVVPSEGHGLAILNAVTTGGAGSEASLGVWRERGSSTLRIDGTVPVDAVEAPSFTAAVENPALFFARSLKDALRARGFAIAGDAVDGDSLAPDDPARGAAEKRVLARHLSASLRETARTFMKVSQNLYGELFLKAIGRATGEGSTARGQHAIQETLDNWGVPRDSYVLADGSGLSRLNRVSAEALVRVLERIFRDARHRDAFTRALPIGGQDGTLRNRLSAAWTAGHVRAKTGALSNARALSGYLTNRGGETLVFSIVANNFTLPGWRIERVIDLMVEILAL